MKVKVTKCASIGGERAPLLKVGKNRAEKNKTRPSYRRRQGLVLDSFGASRWRPRAHGMCVAFPATASNHPGFP